MSLWVAALLGLVQGVFMFVPVSSTSHLALTQHLLDNAGADIPAPESPEMILLDLILHVGSVVSILVVMRHRLMEGGRALLRELRLGAAYPGKPADGRYVHLLGMLVLATATTGVLGLGVRAVAPDVFARPAAIAVMLIFTGGLLWWTDRAGEGQRGARAITAGAAIGVGVAQALALLPGLSRSGLTIAVALALGMRRGAAADFSFTVAIPTILAATAVQAAELVRDGVALQIPVSAIALGFVISAAVGVVVFLAVLKLLHGARFRVFTIYVWILALVVLATGIGEVAGTGVG